MAIASVLLVNVVGAAHAHIHNIRGIFSSSLGYKPSMHTSRLPHSKLTVIIYENITLGAHACHHSLIHQAH